MNPGLHAATGKWRPGALRQALIRVLGQFGERGMPVSTLARYAGWSESSVRRELDQMEQLGLVRFATPERAVLWWLTRGGKVLWHLSQANGLQATVLARMLDTTLAVTRRELDRLAQLMLVRYELPGETMTWHLTGKAAP